jgi:putative salt-induced outer membrane protein
MKFWSAIICVVTFLVIPPLVFSEDKKWHDEAELAFVDTGGNTETTSLSLKNTLSYKFNKRIDGSWEATILYGETDGDKTAEQYATEIKANYLFTKRCYLSAIGGWEQDKFGGIDARYSLGPSLGYKFLTGPVHTLFFEAGLNYVMEEYPDDTDENFVEGRAYGEYRFAITDKSNFKQKVKLLYNVEDSENYNIKSETAITTKLSDIFSLKTSYDVKYSNAPTPDDLDKTDTILSVALIVSF